jgi:hypothetical protein
VSTGLAKPWRCCGGVQATVLPKVGEVAPLSKRPLGASRVTGFLSGMGERKAWPTKVKHTRACTHPHACTHTHTHTHTHARTHTRTHAHTQRSPGTGMLILVEGRPSLTAPSFRAPFVPHAHSVCQLMYVSTVLSAHCTAESRPCLLCGLLADRGGALAVGRS